MKIISFLSALLFFASFAGAQTSPATGLLPMICQVVKANPASTTGTLVLSKTVQVDLASANEEKDQQKIGTVDGYDIKIYSPFTIAGAFLNLTIQSGDTLITAQRDLSEASANVLNLDFASKNGKFTVFCSVAITK